MWLFVDGSFFWMVITIGFGNSTKGRRDGVSQYDRRMMKRLILIAVMKDGTEREVPSLVEYEDLKTSGTVRCFHKVEVV